MITNANKFQNYGFHLVTKSPWPIFLSFSLLNLAIGAVLSMHGFNHGGTVISLGLIVTVFGMLLWFRDIVMEGIQQHLQSNVMFYVNIKNYICDLISSKALPEEEVKQALISYRLKFKSYATYESNLDNFGYYLAGLLEGDGHISIPALFKNSTATRIFNPRIVFTTHINNLGLYAFIQAELGNIGRFQIRGNTLRYIIGDLKGIQNLIKLMHGKFRTPKNITFNNLIKFINKKCSLNIPESKLDTSNFGNNSWLTGFSEADANFGIKYVEAKLKTDEMKRSRSEHITLRYRLDQRAYDKPTSSSMLPFMENLASFLNCEVKNYNSNKTQTEVLSLTVAAINKLELLVNYFDKYPLIGDKANDYNNWRNAYVLIISKEHLTMEGKLKIKSLIIKKKI